MSVERAWSSEDGSVLLYLMQIGSEEIIRLNNNGEIKSVYKQGIDVTYALHNIYDNLQRKGISLLEVPIFARNQQMNINAHTAAKERTFVVRVQHTLINLGGNPHGIEQLLVATHTIHGQRMEPMEEQTPMILRNGNKLIGLVQGWELSAEVPI